MNKIERENMNVKKISLIIAVLSIIAGCIPSLHPLYTEKDLVFEKALVGSWQDENNDDSRWTFSQAGDREYKLVYTEDGKTGEFVVHLLKLKDKMFLDFYPVEQEAINGFYASHLVPAHSFMLVKQIEPTLQMCCLNPDKLKEIIRQDPKAVKHEKLGENDDKDIFTAPTEELQSFIMKNIDTAEFFADPSNLKKVVAKPAVK
ncbi:MAG: hypothetical protein WAX69_00715 [Victivallales bacterium]